MNYREGRRLNKQKRAVVYLHKLLDLVYYDPNLANDECKKIYDLVTTDLERDEKDFI